MAHTFDAHSFDGLLSDVEGFVEHAIDHERRLVSLAQSMEGDGRGTGDLLETVRELCVAARIQCQRAETIVTRLGGDGAHRDASRREQLRVLVVDDSVDGRDLAVTVLETSGFRAITASNGLEGVIVAHYARPAVVLMDIAMPVLNGVDAARLLMASAVTRHLKVIAYTAKPDFYTGPLTRLFVDVLPKPARPAAILASVQRFIVSP